MRFLIALFLVGSSDVYASRGFDWFCTEESSFREYEAIVKEVNAQFDKDMNDQEKKIKQMTEMSK